MGVSSSWEALKSLGLTMVDVHILELRGTDGVLVTLGYLLVEDMALLGVLLQ